MKQVVLGRPCGACTRLAGSLILLVPLLLVPPTRMSRAEEKAPCLEILLPASFDRAAAAHLLSRAGLGGSPEEINCLAGLGLDKAVQRLLGTCEPDPVGDFKASFTGFERDQFRKLSQEERRKLRRELQQKDGKQFQQLRAWWFRRMVLSPNPLLEKITLFWHGHFATSQQTVRNSYHMYLQNKTLRSKALGNFKELVRDIARDPAMLRYLDNNRNIRRRPNENFARELMELFTLGRGNYTEEDIKESARAFTGWTFRDNEFTFFERAHDPGEKVFMGCKGKFDGDDIIDVIFKQPAASRFVIRKLFVFFVHDDPPEDVIESLAATFRSSNFEIKPVLSQLFRTKEFYSERARGNQIKSPIQLVAGTFRLLRIDPGGSPVPVFLASRMGQDLFLPPNVKGWDGGASWISTTTIFDRYNFGGFILGLSGGRGNVKANVRGKGPKAEALRRLARARQGRSVRPLPRWKPDAKAVELLGENYQGLGADEVVDLLLKRLLLVPVPGKARQKLIDFYKSADSSTRLQEFIHLILSSPQYELG